MYLYSNAHGEALERLKRLERIEDDRTIAILQRLPGLDGLNCLEVGAGAGSIAAWLAERVGSSGSVLATDIDPSHLDGSKYNVLQHDIQTDDLPEGKFNLVHLRHVLMHVRSPLSVLARIRDSLTIGGYLVVEESDLRTWAALTDHLKAEFGKGIGKVLEVYAARGMNIAMGAMLPGILSDAGYEIMHSDSASRTVAGGSEESAYQGLSTRQLAWSLAKEQPEISRSLAEFAACFGDPNLRYRSRTTVSVCARRVR